MGREGALALGANSTYLLHIHEHLGSVVDNGVFPRRPRACWAFLQRFLKHLCRGACAHAHVCERESDSSSTRASVSGARRLGRLRSRAPAWAPLRDNHRRCRVQRAPGGGGSKGTLNSAWETGLAPGIRCFSRAVGAFACFAACLAASSLNIGINDKNSTTDRLQSGCFLRPQHGGKCNGTP